MILALLLSQKATNKEDFSTLVGDGVSLLSLTATWYFLTQLYMAYDHRIYPSPASLQIDVFPTTRNDASCSISFKDSKKSQPFSVTWHGYFEIDYLL